MFERRRAGSVPVGPARVEGSREVVGSSGVGPAATTGDAGWSGGRTSVPRVVMDVAAEDEAQRLGLEDVTFDELEVLRRR